MTCHFHIHIAGVTGDGPQSERDRLHSVDSKDGEKGLELYEVGLLRSLHCPPH